MEKISRNCVPSILKLFLVLELLIKITLFLLDEERRLETHPDYVESSGWTIPARHGRRSSKLKEEQFVMKGQYKVPIDKVRTTIIYHKRLMKIDRNFF